MGDDSIWKIRYDLAVALALLTIAKTGRPANPNPDVLFYLGDRYWRLAGQFETRGAAKKAKRAHAKAEYYLRASGWWKGPQGPPPAAAMAMPVPKRPTFTEAIGWRTRQRPPDRAA